VKGAPLLIHVPCCPCSARRIKPALAYYATRLPRTLLLTQALPPSLPSSLPHPSFTGKLASPPSPRPLPVDEPSAQQQQHHSPLPPPFPLTTSYSNDGKVLLLPPPRSPPQRPPPQQCLSPIDRCLARREQHHHPSPGASAGTAEEKEGGREGGREGREGRIAGEGGRRRGWVGWNSSDHKSRCQGVGRDGERGRVGIITTGGIGRYQQREASNEV